MTIDKIKDVSIRQFSRMGYEATALSLIAEEVGIKKQSIYSYYKSKDDLFLKLLEEVFEHEILRVSSFVNTNQTLYFKDFLYELLCTYVKEYQKKDEMRFWLRFSFFPPLAFFETINKQIYAYFDLVAKNIEPLFISAQKQGILDNSLSIEDMITAYLNVMDGILVELVYGGMEKVQHRFHASFEIYWRGIQSGGIKHE